MYKYNVNDRFIPGELICEKPLLRVGEGLFGSLAYLSKWDS